MPPRRPAGRSASRSKKRGRRLRANIADPPAAPEYWEEAPASELTVPTRWVKAVAGLFLLPVCYIVTVAVGKAFLDQAVGERFWASEEFWFFGLGALLWLITFFGLPKPVIIYIFGHELTHALWVWLMGGRVSRIAVTSEGGHILADKKNVLISLAPYFFPLYTGIVLVSWAFWGAFFDLEPYRRWLFGLVGATWCFHLTFTCWMIPQEQPDLLDHGSFFSLIVIYLFNVGFLAFLFVLASPNVSFADLGQSLLDEAIALSTAVLNACDWVQGRFS